MTWNYRIIKHDLKKPYYLAVHEVFYDEKGKIISWTMDPITLGGHNKTEVLASIKYLIRDLKTPMLSEVNLNKIFESNKFKLELTSHTSPEQYEAYLDGEQVGYLRLRHGIFRVDFPDCGGETIYVALPKGDGCFEDDERNYYLNEARNAISKRLSSVNRHRV